MAFDLPLTIGFFLIITGILTWTALAVWSVWHVFGAIENTLDKWAATDERRRMLKIYRHG